MYGVVENQRVIEYCLLLNKKAIAVSTKLALEDSKMLSDAR